MNLNMTHALELAEYAHQSAIELLDYALASYIADMHQTYHNTDCDAITAARYISADQLESAAFANSILDSLFDDFLPMMLIFSMIESAICSITNCDIADIAAEY